MNVSGKDRFVSQIIKTLPLICFQFKSIYLLLYNLFSLDEHYVCVQLNATLHTLLEELVVCSVQSEIASIRNTHLYNLMLLFE